jgi:predicted flap endonuclease-1-like 5' DNA nuclease
MIDQSILIWGLVGAALFAVLAIVIGVRSSRRHVELPRTTLDDGPAMPTLAREQRIADVMSVAAAPATTQSELSKLKGVGPKLVARLADLGVTQLDQIAAWTGDDIAAINAQLGPFAGRIERDKWVEQARLLSSDDIAAYETAFGKIDGIRS